LSANPKLLTAGESGDRENIERAKTRNNESGLFFVFSTFRVFVILRFPGVTRIGGQSCGGRAALVYKPPSLATQIWYSPHIVR
jgi:hypothetical protein